MILGIIVICRVVIQELETRQSGVGGGKQVGGIALILRGIHHVDILRFEGHTRRKTCGDTGSHTVRAFCLDDNHTICALGTVKGSSVAQHRHLFDVRHGDVRQDIIVESVVEHGSAILLVDDHTIYYDKRLGVDVERVKTVHKHHSTDTRCTVALYGMYISTEAFLYLLLNRDGTAETESRGLFVACDVSISIIVTCERLGVQACVALLFAGSQSILDTVVAGGSDKQR